MKSSFNGDCLRISIDNTEINLPAQEQDELRQELAKNIRNVFFDQNNTKELLQAKLDEREFIFVIWNWLKDEEFSDLLHQISTENLLMLLRYMRQKTPNLLKRIRSFWDESTEEDLLAQMEELSKIPAVRIIQILDDIHAYLTKIFGEIMPELPPENYSEEEAKNRFDDISAYVKALPSVPPDRGKVILSCISTTQKVKLLAMADKYRWKDYPDWILNMEGEQQLQQLKDLTNRLPPQPLWEEMKVLEPVYNLMAPGAATNAISHSADEVADNQVELPLLLENKTKEFLHKLGKLSTKNLQVLLRFLSKKDMLELLFLVEYLGITNLHEGMHACLPARIYDQLVLHKPKSINQHEVQDLLKNINLTIKKLKQDS